LEEGKSWLGLGEGSNNIGKVYINEKQYFEKVDEEVWSYDLEGIKCAESG
jgi:hypothetical protein